MASAFWLFLAASMATPVIMHAKAMLAPTINSVIKMIMRSVNCDACASFVILKGAQGKERRVGCAPGAITGLSFDASSLRDAW